MAKIEYGTYYHLYNRGNNRTDIFKGKEDYIHFLNLVKKYVLLVADIYCYSLMRNHFHMLLRIKENDEIDYLIPGYIDNPDRKWRTTPLRNENANSNSRQKLKKPVPYRQLSHLFNSYAKWFNVKYKRTGSLFEKNYRKKEIRNDSHLKQVLYYIHNNPIHHGFTTNFIDYPWTSYLILSENKSTFLDKETVFEWFSDLDDFIHFHQNRHNFSTTDLDEYE